MFEQVDFREAVGKTVRAVSYVGPHRIAVSFTDQTFSVLEAELLYEDDTRINAASELSCAVVNQSTLEELFGEHAAEMLEAGIKAREEREMSRELKFREARRAQYEELKKEFGGE